MEDTQGNRKETNISTLIRHSEGVLLNLAQAVFKRRWLLVAVNSTIQAKPPVYSDNNWQARTLVNIVNNLKDHGLFY